MLPLKLLWGLLGALPTAGLSWAGAAPPTQHSPSCSSPPAPAGLSQGQGTGLRLLSHRGSGSASPSFPTGLGHRLCSFELSCN